MTSHVTEDFVECFETLPERIQRLARKSYKLWKTNPRHPGLEFKKIHIRKPIYSVRIAIGWRALGIISGDAIIWFWIGSHADYDKLISKL